MRAVYRIRARGVISTEGSGLFPESAYLRRTAIAKTAIRARRSAAYARDAARSYPSLANGIRLIRTPVADAMALAIAGAIGGIAISPNPVGRTRLGRNVTSITAGASRLRISR